jgi:hypothetical protein
MVQPKAFASLSSGLLARKGAARPAMRPQGFGQVGAGLEDLGWNDMGFEAPKPALAPVLDDQHDGFGAQLSEPALRHPLSGLTPSGVSPTASPVHDQRAEIADRFADYTEDATDEDYIDETAELYDPEAEGAAGPDDQDEPHTPVLATKPNRAPLNLTVAAMEPVASESPIVVEVAPVVEAMAPFEAAAVVEQQDPVEAPRVLASQPPSAPASLPRAPRHRAEPGSKAKAAFTLRLDATRHLKLRLACAVTGRSAQQLVTEALDQLLAAMPELDNMAERAPSKRADR